MTIDEAIKHCEEVAERYERMEDSPDDKLREECLQCTADHRQLAEWLAELKKLREQKAEYKRLMKVAVEDIKYLINHAERNGKACDRCKYGDEMYCYADDCSNDAKWRHEAEALKLIGEESETNG